MSTGEPQWIVEVEAAVYMMAPQRNRLRAWLLDTCGTGCVHITADSFRQLRDLHSSIAEELRIAGIQLVEIDGNILAVSKQLGTKLNSAVSQVLKLRGNEGKIYRLAAAYMKGATIITVDVESPISTKKVCESLEITAVEPEEI
jgi:hypothetical protein